MRQIQSIVIVKGSHGYTASLRFTNFLKDVEIHNRSKYLLYRQIDNYLSYVRVSQ